jgi:hypothetical protein
MYRRANSPWTNDEDLELFSLEKSSSISSLSKYFERTQGAISSRLKHIELGKRGDKISKITSMLHSIVNGYDPTTGDLYNDDSIWKHPAIVEDVEELLDIIIADGPPRAAIQREYFEIQCDPLITPCEATEEVECDQSNFENEWSFFRFENHPNYKPNIGLWRGTEEDIKKIRNENQDEGRLMNHGLPITEYEKRLVFDSSQQGVSMEKLESYFQRSTVSLVRMIGSINERGDNIQETDTNDGSCVFPF